MKVSKLIGSVVIVVAIYFGGKTFIVPHVPVLGERKTGTSPTILKATYWSREISLSQPATVRFTASNTVFGAGIQNQKSFDFYVVTDASFAQFQSFFGGSGAPPQFLVRQENVTRVDGVQANLPAGKSHIIIDNSRLGSPASAEGIKIQYTYSVVSGS